MAKNTEAVIQAAVVKYVRQVCPDVLIFHPANGEKREPAIAAKLKWMGVVRGIPDLVLLFEGKHEFAYVGGRVAFWEIKSPSGRLSEAQELVASWLELSGFSYSVIRSIDNARQALAELGIETRESLS